MNDKMNDIVYLQKKESFIIKWHKGPKRPNPTYVDVIYDLSNTKTLPQFMFLSRCILSQPVSTVQHSVVLVTFFNYRLVPAAHVWEIMTNYYDYGTN